MSIQYFKKRVCLAGGVSLAALIVMPAAAQDLPKPSSRSDAANQLEEIIVTARRTTENVQDVPATIAVLTAAALENRAVTNLSNINGLVSNIYWEDLGGSTLENRITIRGITSNASKNGFDPGVGIYIDDVYIGDVLGFNSALLDIDRVEVLKGPQGTLFGRNTTAGAIAVHTRRPSTTEAFGEASGQIGNYKLRDMRGFLNVPLSSIAALKISTIYRDREGYQFNTVTNRRDANDDNYYGGRAQLLLTPSSTFDLLLSADWFKTKGSQDVLTCYGVGANFNPCGTLHPTVESIYDNKLQSNDTHNEREMWSMSAVGTARLGGGFELTSVSAYRNITGTSDQDQDYVALDYIRSGFIIPKNWQFSQEFRITTPQGNPLRAVGGLYYFHEERVSVIPQVFKAPYVVLLGGPNADGVQTTSGDQGTTSYAIFGQSQWDPVSWATLEVGLRYTRDRKSFIYEQVDNLALEQLPDAIRNAQFLFSYPRSSAKDSWGKMTGTASLSLRPADGIMAYARFSRGYKSGGFQLATNSSGLAPTVPFGPETVDQWEGGLKTELFNRRVRLNFSGYISNYDDIQTQITDPITRQKFIANAGTAESKGAEVELSALVFPGFTIDANAGLLRAKFTSFIAGGPAANIGKDIAYAPRRTGTINATYDFGIGGRWRGLISGSAIARSKMWVDTANNVNSPAVTTFNARVGAQFDEGRYGIYLWGANLTNEQRVTQAANAKAGLFLQAYHISVPRTFGLELKGKF